jgi:hypothetical protein
MSHISEVIAQREHLSSEVDAIMAAHPAGEYPPEVQQRLTEIRAKADQLTEREKTIALREELRQRPGRALSNTEKAPDSGLRVFSNAPAHVPEGFDGVF